MFYATYNPNKKGDNIGGFYPLTHNDVPKPSIQITKKQRDDIINFPGHFRVESGKLTKIKDTRQELQRRQLNNFRKEASSKNQAPLVVGDYKYFVDSSFMDNLNLNLSLCSMVKNHSCQLWRISSSDTWEFAEHNKQMLIDVAVAFNSRRENISNELYGQSVS